MALIFIVRLLGGSKSYLETVTEFLYVFFFSSVSSRECSLISPHKMAGSIFDLGSSLNVWFQPLASRTRRTAVLLAQGSCCASGARKHAVALPAVPWGCLPWQRDTNCPACMGNASRNPPQMVSWQENSENGDMLTWHRSGLPSARRRRTLQTWLCTSANGVGVGIFPCQGSCSVVHAAKPRDGARSLSMLSSASAPPVASLFSFVFPALNK